MVSDAQIVRFIRDHPEATAREVAQRFYTASAQLAVGARLKRLVAAGALTQRFHDGWKYSVSALPNGTPAFDAVGKPASDTSGVSTRAKDLLYE